MKSEYIDKDDPEKCLGHLIEGCGEVLAAAGKIVRFGPKNFNPELAEKNRESNEEWLARELADLRTAIDNMDRWLP